MPVLNRLNFPRLVIQIRLEADFLVFSFGMTPPLLRLDDQGEKTAFHERSLFNLADI